MSGRSSDFSSAKSSSSHLLVVLQLQLQLLNSSVYFNTSSESCSSTFHQQGLLQLLIGKRGFSKLLSLLLLINLSSSLNGKHDCSEWPQNCSVGLTTSLEELQKLIKFSFQFATKVADEAKAEAQKRKLSSENGWILGGDEEEDENDEDKTKV